MLGPFLIVLGALAFTRNLLSLLDAVKYRKKVLRRLNRAAEFAPEAAVIVPCRGVDPGFDENVTAMLRQSYPRFSVIFVTESKSDPAYARLRCLTARRKDVEVVTAGTASGCAQKIHNLLAGVQHVAPTAAILVFGDSDIRPHPLWLQNLVAPLADSRVGATTGYRWYLPLVGNFWSAVRSVWNMTSANVLFSQRFGFAWGGSTAIRKQTFEHLDIAKRWRTGLSDDMILTHAVKAQGLEIEFVPGSVAVSAERIAGRDFFEWTTRQLRIIRIYDPVLWRFAAYPQWLFSAIFCVGAALVGRDLLVSVPVPLAAWFMLSDLPGGAVINLVRLSAFKRALADYGGTLPFPWWVYGGLHLVSAFAMSLSLLAASRSNRIVWRGIRYEMRSPGETVVLGG